MTGFETAVLRAAGAAATALARAKLGRAPGAGLTPTPARPAALRAEQALGTSDRVLLRGPAGSGKSTLLQRLALNAARQADGPWATCVPFVLRLRSFTTTESLPMPEDFLKASGVPMSAPPGWVEDLMLSGRALVLVDGVDEVPQRLRTRTEHWLRSLVSAFPVARYVVTTRPSAVPEDWLAGQGFTPHSLLPMEREDIGAFVAHWHRAARAECPGEDLDPYEASLLEAVSARRDLGRLATNPLMCALLCALNRDRRMQLPRARKELYDAALDMLLVRRDTEREIGGVEGVYLTRDEQILLLQRFAYWLIRNGQVEAGRELTLTGTGSYYRPDTALRPGRADRRAQHEDRGRRFGADPARADQVAEPLLIRPAGPVRHQTRTEPPLAKAGLVASGGTAVKGSAISATSGPCFAASASSRAGSKP